MKTFLRQTVSALLMICLTVGVLPAMSISADAASEEDSILAKINELYDFLGNTYFNEKHQGADQCGKKTSGHGCSHCLTGNIVKAKWFIDTFGKISTNQFPTHYLTEKSFATQSAYSCAGFANFAEWYIFKEKTTDKVAVENIGVYDFNYANVKKYAKVGDVLRLNNAHSAILVGINEKSVTVLDSN